MAEFHATLSPGLLRNTRGTLTLSFDSPEEAEDVAVTLWEVDRWGRGREAIREQGGGPDDLIAEFRGEIADGRFTGRLARQGRARASAPRVHLRIDGDGTVHELPVPAGGNEHEQGVLEINVRVQGRIGGRRKRFTSGAPVFVRNFAFDQERPVVAFMTGRGGGYFAAASRYWRGHADGRFDRASVEEILAFVRTESQRRGYGIWGEVNIVSHGNEFEWLIKLFRRDRRTRHVSRAVLDENAADPRLAPPGAAHLDRQSRVVIRGCALGNDQPLLDRIRRLMGGQATLFAPKYLQYYRYDVRGGVQTTREGFWEFYYIYVPGSRSPREADCIERLHQAYAGPSEADWRAMLRNRQHRRDRTETFPYTITYDARPPRGQDHLQVARDNWENGEGTFNTDFDDWAWTVGRLQRRRRGGGFRVVVTGRRRRIEVRREMRDAEGNPVIPDIDNHEHFGRSPAW